jgi:hypothetical protein
MRANMSDTDGLVPRTFEPLPLGTIEPRGWLRRQLRIQADGLTGHLDEFWPSLADNQWLGGENDGWERGPYYADGLVPLAYLLEDDDLIAKAETWIEGFLDQQQDDGWIGPRDPAFDPFSNDPWPVAVVLKAFEQYHDATGDDRVLDASVRFCRCLHDGALDAHPLEEWARFRWADLALGVHWCYEATEEAWLLDLADQIAEQGYDWVDHLAGGRRRLGLDYCRVAEERAQETHVVNNAMGIKAPAVRYRQSGEADHREAVRTGIDRLDAFHGQATGVFTGDEHLAGREPSRGTELCAVVEYCFSLERAMAILGEAWLGDRLERIAYNALPATFTADMWAHQYDQQANQVWCGVGDYPWTNDPDANVFGLEPNYGCCTANMHQGWPKFANHCWMRSNVTADGPENLAAVAYAPSAVTTELDGRSVTVVEETDYPFADDVTITVQTDGAAHFGLDLRVPAWCEDATLRTPDGERSTLDAGGFHTVEREWTDGETVRLGLSAPVDVERRYQGGVAIRRGPLVFSLPLASDAQPLPGEPDEPYAHREYHPTESWNYGLAFGDGDADGSATIERSPPGEVPFSPDDPPVRLTVPGARVPEWTMNGPRAGPIPDSPTRGRDRESLTLIPYGSTTLRVTEFPLIE